MTVNEVDPAAVGRCEADVLAIAEEIGDLRAEDLDVGEVAGGKGKVNGCDREPRGSIGETAGQREGELRCVRRSRRCGFSLQLLTVLHRFRMPPSARGLPRALPPPPEAPRQPSGEGHAPPQSLWRDGGLC